MAKAAAAVGGTLKEERHKGHGVRRGIAEKMVGRMAALLKVGQTVKPYGLESGSHQQAWPSWYPGIQRR